MVRIGKHLYREFQKHIIGAGAFVGILPPTCTAHGAGPDVTIDPRADNFDRPENVQNLYQLLMRDAQSACRDRQVTGSRIRAVSWLKCVEGALDVAAERVHRATLTDYDLAYGASVGDDSSRVSRRPGGDAPRASFAKCWFARGRYRIVTNRVRRRVTGKAQRVFRRLPLGSLRVFVAVAHSLNFTRAAESLGLSLSAASLQVRVLEEYLGHALIRRNGREVALTREGAALLPRVQAALEMLESALDDARAVRESGVLRVTTLSSFLQQWLLPRLPTFRALHPQLEFHFHTTASVVDFVREEYHVAIRLGKGPWPGLHVEQLMPEWLIPVCTPSLLTRLGTVEDIKSLGRYALLHSTTEPWTSWLLGGIVANPPDQLEGSSLDDSLALIRMAERGQGLALARWSLVADEIGSGTLVAAGRPVQFQRSYWFACPARLRNVVSVKAFRDWLMTEAAKFGMPSGVSAQPETHQPVTAGADVAKRESER